MLGLRGRMTLTAVAASGAALLIVLWLLTPRLRERAIDHTRDQLLAEARLMARIVQDPLARGAGPELLDPIVDEAAREVEARITIVGLDGRVLADSSLSGPELLAVENHGSRPEVQQALATGVGSAVRHSATIGSDLLYAAVAIRAGGKAVGVARVALPLAGVEAGSADLIQAATAALALAFALTAFLSAAFARPLAGPLAKIMAGARELARGNLKARIPVGRADELGELARILNQSADQLEQRLLEGAEDRARTEAILSAMEEGVLAVDARGVVLLANDALLESLGVADPVGRHYVEAIRQPEVDAVIQHVLAYGERHAIEMEAPHLRRSFALTGVPLISRSRAPQGAVLTFHDITELRRLERVRRDFVANASHELRTPLTSIRGFVEALEDGAALDRSTAERFLGKIRVHADRMAALVEDLLELSRLESGGRPPRLEEVAPAEVVDDVLASFSSIADKRSMTLAQSDRGAPLVTTDGERLRRILDALVDNALKYTPDGGRVELVTLPGPDGGAVVEVRDNGPGIPREHLARIFERFYRVDKARSRELGGTGLGLAIVRHLAEGMGASVAVESELGQGACFSVRLPAGPAEGPGGEA